jgi:hypothetical protein
MIPAPLQFPDASTGKRHLHSKAVIDASASLVQSHSQYVSDFCSARIHSAPWELEWPSLGLDTPRSNNKQLQHHRAVRCFIIRALNALDKGSHQKIGRCQSHARHHGTRLHLAPGPVHAVSMLAVSAGLRLTGSIGLFY